MTVVNGPTHILLVKALGTFNLSRMKILSAIEHHRVIVSLPDPSSEALCPAGPSHFVKYHRQLGAQRLDWNCIQDLTHLRVAWDLVSVEDGLEVRYAALLLHALLEIKQAGVLKEEHSKSGHQCVVDRETDAVRSAAIRQEVKSAGK